MTFISISMIVTGVGLTLAAVTRYLAYKSTKKLENDRKDHIITFTSDNLKCRENCIPENIICGQECAYKKMLCILHLISNAKDSIDVCVCLITLSCLVVKLIELHGNGIKVRVIVDDRLSNCTGSKVKELKAVGIPVVRVAARQTMHHKFCIIDAATSNRTLLNGSLNWTFQGVAGNFEYVVVTFKERCINDFLEEFTLLWDKYH